MLDLTEAQVPCCAVQVLPTLWSAKHHMLTAQLEISFCLHKAATASVLNVTVEVEANLTARSRSCRCYTWIYT